MPKKGVSLTPEHLAAMAEGRRRAAAERDAVVSPIRPTTRPVPEESGNAAMLTELRASRTLLEAIRALLETRLPSWAATAPSTVARDMNRETSRQFVAAKLDRAKEAVRQFTNTKVSDGNQWNDTGSPSAVPAVEPDGAEDVFDLGDELTELNREIADELPPPPSLDEQWVSRLDKFKRFGMWLPEWSGRPGQADCDAPVELLEEYGFVKR
jgi:hypothetical protein